MGVFQEQLEPLLAEYQQLGLASRIGLGFAAFLVLAVVLNVAKQVLFKNSNEPPMVFHLFPFIGSTVEYGMDPPKFFKKMRAKVRSIAFCSRAVGWWDLGAAGWMMAAHVK